MRYIYFALLVILSAVVFTFKFQNLEMVTVVFLNSSLSLPLSLLLFLVYVLGMLTGGSLFALLKSWVRGARVQKGAAD
jgi:uncharacterized integral membrane protein